MGDDALQTPLTDAHLRHGAKLVTFAGYSLPIQFPAGVMAEHLHTRAAAGLFDVSHMGQIWLDGPDWQSLALAVEALVPQDVLGLADGRQRYGFFTNATGGIEDDLMFARHGDRLFMVVNGACKAADLQLLQTGLPQGISVSYLEDRALVALQGPASESALSTLLPEVVEMRFMDFRVVTWQAHDIYVSRSGYTGEDGFEISVPARIAEEFTEQLLAHDAVEPAGLGARDSLRLEAGLCLYGQDLDAATTPVQADLVWAIQKARKPHGTRAGGYPGADVIARELETGAERKRVGLRPEGRAPVRAGVEIFSDDAGTARVGQVTSGGFGPSLSAPVSMGYVRADMALPDTQLFAMVRGKPLPVRVCAMPFVQKSFKKS